MSEHDHHQQTLSERYGQETWDARYSESDRIWSGNPNQRLVEQVTGLTPGTALDVGAGEGADSVWLARQGWQVTALDVSPVALAKTAAHAAEAGVEVTTVQHDLVSLAPLPGSYDLVSAQFWHPPLERFADFRDVIGAAVRPGGTLLVVAHHPASLQGQPDTHGHAAFLFDQDKVAALFDTDEWDVQVSAAQTRPTTRPDGPAEVTDSVFRAVRRA
ncbi:MAG: class I SAM-dependent methyltransferase [Methylobacterium sp.]|nr:MAG: class I SAM-dependent methyltransferase [Methylobacterium sp.]